MSYQVLARKWRPQKFSDVVGQKPVLTALANGLNENRLHHAYLFSGTRGVGKTSIARLFAKGLNCVEGVTANPCGVCEHCKAIEEGRFIDLIEIDAASRTKVEDTRELLDNVQYKPVQGRYKVYLIDEVHMLSRHSFNALLKTLEEPPEYVKFLLATTDPQKLPITILSRCIQFHLKALDQQQIADHLSFILQQEKIPFEPLAIEKLAKAAQGSIRDSLSLTDQAIAMSNSNITLDAVNTMLGLLDDSQPIDILYALQQGNGEALMKAIQAVAEKGGDWNELLKAVAENLHKIAMCQLLPQAQMSDESHIGFLAKHLPPEDVQFFYQIILNGQKELAFAPNQRMGVEMILLRALAFHPKLIQAAPAMQPVEQANERNNSAQSAGQNPAKLVEMPVVSQQIKANSPSQPQTTPSARQAVRSTPSHSSSPVSNSTLDVLDALDQLSKPTASEKKNTNANNAKLVSEPAVSHSQEISLPVVERKFTQQKNTARATHQVSQPSVSQSAISQAPSQSAAMISLVSEPVGESAVQNPPDFSPDLDQEEDLNLPENYRWNWSNPAMAEEQDTASPSEIRKAILENTTPELKEKVLTMAKAQDKWTEIIEQLDISGLAKQMAMNCVILSQDEKQIRLGLRQDKLHLNNEKLRIQLQNALSQFYQQDMAVSVDVNTDFQQLTPMDYRKQIYQELSDQARENLQADERLQRLCEEFGGVLELDSVRPV
ncbi:DNA polymerase III subunit gamma/tau [Avibacterium gallinarum]|uniref:DNA polymerase III subunit gamma/tau n=1 Tax=Avibacterium gallinarum TaxID=755 RepID=A0A379AVR7_AVIGA|nr:DNA polymerase III subunit gamma/tau [Avibacterium gallinarum]TDP27673.1 DNA polymerase-3 subunit gamma/tau [Avibacterium gallinarum]SUB26101.1 DNA polymerase III subunit gamma/tau [Avibacterium gallinarum]